MRKPFFLLLSVLAGLSAAPLAHAQDPAPAPGAPGAPDAPGDATRPGLRPNLVAIDGLAGVFNIRQTLTLSSGAETKQTTTSYGLVGGIGEAYPISRLGYHRLVGPLSLGAGFFYAKTDLLDAKQAALSPRVGVVVPLGGSSWLWARGGIDYLWVKTERGTKTSSVLAGGEVLFVLSPHPGFSFTLGPTAAFSVSGSQELDRPGVSIPGATYRARVLGLTTGALIDF